MYYGGLDEVSEDLRGPADEWEDPLRTHFEDLCEVGDSEENFSQGVDDAVARMIQRCCGEVAQLRRRPRRAPVAGSLRIGTINLVPVAKCIGVGFGSP